MFSAYRMVQPGTTYMVGGVPGAANGAAAAAAAAAAAQQQSIVYTTLPQYQAQWESVVLVHPYWRPQQQRFIGSGGGGMRLMTTTTNNAMTGVGVGLVQVLRGSPVGVKRAKISDQEEVVENDS